MDQPTRRRRRWGRAAAAALAALALAGGAQAGDKTDQVLLINGDVVKGDVKRLVQGMLTFRTDSMGTVSIEWTDVVQVTSKYTFQIELFDGQRYLGSFVPPPRIGLLAIHHGDDWDLFELKDVVRIEEIRPSFVERLDGYVSLGFSYTKASDVAQLNFATQVTYKDPEFLVQLDSSTIITSQAAAPTQTRTDNYLTYTRRLPERWSAFGLLGAQRNDELGLQFRGLAGGGVGRTIAQGTHTDLGWIAGLVINHEDPSGSESEPTQNLEALGRLTYKVFYYSSPKLSLDTSLTAYPGITDFGRLRAQFDFRASKELIKDFTLDLTLYHTLDTRPPNPDASTTDYGVILGLGYSF